MSKQYMPRFGYYIVGLFLAIPIGLIICSKISNSMEISQNLRPVTTTQSGSDSEKHIYKFPSNNENSPTISVINYENQQNYKLCNQEILTLYFTTELDAGRVDISKNLNNIGNDYWQSYNNQIINNRIELIHRSRQFQTQTKPHLEVYDNDFDYSELLEYIKTWNKSNIGKPLKTKR
jgi:hypothetical protein